MSMKILNFFFGLFGYEWVRDERPYEPEADQIQDEGWDDVYEHSPRYVLRRKSGRRF